MVRLFCHENSNMWSIASLVGHNIVNYQLLDTLCFSATFNQSITEKPFDSWKPYHVFL